METVTTSIRVDANTLAAYDELARTTGRSRNYLLREALREYLSGELGQQARLDRSIAQAEAGQFADEEEQQAWKAALFADSGVTPEQHAAYADEAARDLRQAHGLPPCE